MSAHTPNSSSLACTMWLTTFLAGATFALAADEPTIRQQSNSIGVDVVVVAHADDWQAFMGDAIVERIKSGRRPVSLYMTAGDHGREAAYWRQRELGAMQSTRIALGVADSPVSCDSVLVRQHRIAHCK